MRLFAFMSDEIDDATSCPRCNADLESKRESYLVDVNQRRGTESFMIGCDGGWFCPKCPTVVLDPRAFKNMVSVTAGGRSPRYTVLGIVDMGAVPKSKRHLPLGEKGNPIPLIEFKYATTELQEPEKVRPKKVEKAKPKKPRSAKPTKVKRAISGKLRAIVSGKPKPAKVGRNDPCPCGSGKKYKKCCMGKRKT
jgi:hypothetical protein